MGGADINLQDDNWRKKLPLHWAINNQLSCNNKTSDTTVEIVKCLLNNGAKTDIFGYDKCTPLEYAESRKFTAAAHLIKEYNARRYTRGATIGLFKDILPEEVSGHLSLFLNRKDGNVVARVRKDAWIKAKQEGASYWETKIRVEKGLLGNKRKFKKIKLKS